MLSAQRLIVWKRTPEARPMSETKLTWQQEMHKLLIEGYWEKHKDDKSFDEWMVERKGLPIKFGSPPKPWYPPTPDEGKGS